MQTMPATQQTQILIVDTDRSFSLNASSILSGTGHGVTTVDGATAALAELSANRFDLAIVGDHDTGATVDLLGAIARTCSCARVLVASDDPGFADNYGAWLADGLFIKGGPAESLACRCNEIIGRLKK